MKIKANDGQGFVRLMVGMTRDEQFEWPGCTADLIAAIRGELDALAYLDEKVEKDNDAYLEALVRIAAMARFHAAGCDLAYAKGVMA